MKSEKYVALGCQSIIQAQVSDHKPLIKDGVLSWNIMMRGRKTERGFNTAFALQETQEQYQQRLTHIAAVLAEIASAQTIRVIALQEAPIESADIEVFRVALARYEILKEFLPALSSPQRVSIWGLMTLVAVDVYDWQHALSVWSGELAIFNDRVQQVRVSHKHSQDVEAITIMNVHMPYREAHNHPDYVNTKLAQMFYRRVTADIPHGLIIVGDFNVNPQHFSVNPEHVFSREHNNVQLGEQCCYRENVDALVATPATFSALLAQAGMFRAPVRAGNIGTTLQLDICRIA